MKKEHVKLTEEDRQELTKMTAKGKISGRKYKRALALLELDRGKTYEAASKTLEVKSNTLSTLAKRYRAEGLECLNDRPRPGRPIKFSGKDRAQVTAVACSDAPEGYSQWSTRLLADRVVELGYVESISHTQVHTILKKTN